MTTITITADLIKSLVNKGDKRRAGLRQLAMPLLQKVDEAKLTAAAQQNPRVAAGQLNPRMSYSGIRDQMTALALTSLVSGAQSPEETIAAIALDMNPTEFGMVHSTDPHHVGAYLANLMDHMQKGDADAVEITGADAASNNINVTLPDNWRKLLADYGGDDLDEALGTTKAAPSTPRLTLPVVDASKVSIVDTVLKSLGIPSYEDIRKGVDGVYQQLDAAASKPSGLTINYEFVGQPALAAANGIPAGTLKKVKAFDAFGITAGKDQFDFDLPLFDWASPHPYVPEVDSDYQFQPVPLLRALWALATNQKAWLHGHTGTGKSTLIEQIAARLQWPMIRINFDSEITRMDLIGRDVLQQSGGNVTTRFEDGTLPKAMQMPCILLCDEMDFIRPDVAYVMQRALENKGLLITEDGGRLITPDPMFRIIATANTKGAGDDTGRYMGARPQSGAFLDRFTCWIEVEYMTPAAVMKLIAAKTKGIPTEVVKVLGAYAKEHWIGFRNGDILQPLSPRGLISAANAYTFFSGVMPQAEALKQAIRTTISERCTETDAQTIDGLVQRVTS